MRANVGGRHAGEIKKSKIKFARMAASYIRPRGGLLQFYHDAAE